MKISRELLKEVKVVIIIIIIIIIIIKIIIIIIIIIIKYKPNTMLQQIFKKIVQKEDRFYPCVTM